MSRLFETPFETADPCEQPCDKLWSRGNRVVGCRSGNFVALEGQQHWVCSLGAGRQCHLSRRPSRVPRSDCR